MVYKIQDRMVLARLNRTAEKLGWYGESQQGFRNNRGCDHTLFISNRIDQMGIEKDHVAYKLFVDNTKAYDIVSRNTLWLVLKRRGVPDKFLNLIKSALVGSRARLKTKTDKECEYFDLLNGLKQGAILSRCEFNIFMGAIMEEIRKRMKEKGIGAKIEYDLDCNPLVRNRKGSNMNSRNKGEVDVTDILFADDSCFIAIGNANQMQEVATIVDEVMSAFGQKVSIAKTKIMQVIRKKNTTHDRDEEDILCAIHDEEIEVVDTFQYVGTQVTNNACMKTEVTTRATKMKANYYQFRHTIFENPKTDLWIKLTMFRVFVLPAGCYNCAAWHASAKLVKKLDSVARKLLCRIFGFKWYHYVSYDYLIKLCKLLGSDMTPISMLASKYRLKFLGRIIRSPDSNLVKQLLYGEYAGGSRPVGRPETQWTDCVVKDLKSFLKLDPKEEWNVIKECAMNVKNWELGILQGLERNVIPDWYEKHKERRKVRMRKKNVTPMPVNEGLTMNDEEIDPAVLGIEIENEELEKDLNIIITRTPLQSISSATMSSLEKKLGFKKG